MGGRLWTMALGVCAAAVVACPAADAAKLRLRHHGDPARALRHSWGGRPIAHAAANTLNDLETTWCGVEQTADVGSPLSNAPQVKVIYAYAHDQADRFSSYANLIQSDVNTIRERFADDSGNTKSVRFDLGNVAPGGGCGGKPTTKYVDIQVVQLPQNLAAYGPSSPFTTLKNDLLTALGPLPPGARVDYVVYADKIFKTGAAGEADTPIDDSKGYGNGTNHGLHGDGRLFAMIYGRDSGAPAQFNGGTQNQRLASFLHELSHTQGAVQSSAPHSSGAGHCYDERDIMCYNDNGPYFTGGGSLTTPCPTGTDGEISEALDCGGDDYFNASPAGGSYLATHWNEYDSIYLCPVASCDSAIGSPAVSLSAPATAFRGSNVTFTANVTGATIARYEWDVNNDGLYDTDTGTTPTLSGPFSSNGTRTIRVRASTADGVFGTDAKSITISEPTTPTPTFTVTPNPPVAGATAIFDASGTSDPSGVITNYKWDFDGDGVAEVDGGTSKTATTVFPTAGARTVTLEVDYPTGVSKIGGSFTVASAGGGGGGGTPKAAPTLSGKVVRLAALLKSGLPLTISCGAGCTLAATLKAKGKTIGSLRRTLTAAGRLRAAVKLTAAAKRKYRRAQRLVVTLTAKVTQAGFQPLTLNRRLTIRR